MSNSNLILPGSFVTAVQEPLKNIKQNKTKWKVILALNLLCEIAILVLSESFNSKRIEHQVADQLVGCHTEPCKLNLNQYESLTESSLEIITYLGVSFALFTLLGLVFESGYFMLINSFLNLICFIHSLREFGDRNITWALCLTMILSQFIGTVIFIRKVRLYNEACHRYDIELETELIPSTIRKSTREQPTTPPPDYHEFISNPGKYPKPRTITSLYSSTKYIDSYWDNQCVPVFSNLDFYSNQEKTI